MQDLSAQKSRSICSQLHVCHVCPPVCDVCPPVCQQSCSGLTAVCPEVITNAMKPRPHLSTHSMPDAPLTPNSPCHNE